MAQITVGQFLNGIEMNVARVHKYRLGGDGSDGECDCIGLLIGALKLMGLKWPWTHGSNYAARNQINDLHYVSSANQLEPGMVVFKAREPGEPGYSLPDKYKHDPDQKDYYHVGVVTQVNPLRITHCTSVAGGIKVDTSLGQWHYAGYLKQVNYSGGDQPVDPLYQATVVADSGKTVRMRRTPAANGAIVKNIPIGSVVDVLDELDEWAKVSYDGLDGYMMRKFLSKVKSDDDDCTDDDLSAKITKIYGLLLEALNELSDIGVG